MELDRGDGSAGLEMIGAGLSEVGEIALRLDDHQVHIERLPRATSHRFDYHRPDRDIRHKATVHYVDMDPVRSRRIDGANLLGETPEIRRQDRRRDNDRPCGTASGITDPALNAFDPGLALPHKYP